MKILINTPSLKLLGGVANHYEGLKDYWTENVKYNTTGRRTSKRGSGKYWVLWDIFKFIFKLITFRPNVVLLNPSIGLLGLKRDFIFQCIARSLGFRVALFIHGFNWDNAKQLDKKWVVKHFNKSVVIFVLAKAFKDELEAWGVKVPICLSTTKVDDKLLVNYNPAVHRNGIVKNLLFLARIEKAKGVFIAIDSYRILKAKFPDLSLTVVGDGADLPKVKQCVEKYKLKDVIIAGRLSGKELINAYVKADVLLFRLRGRGECVHISHGI